ncbi:TraG family conjugative transposon ATPase [Pedobacter antarcticus]|uniref:TraG family conjugative transposon ATPase n=1 Tax=Pedobacter antarcticus TaxID=34086 RepID=UPI0008805C7A|nr:TraG family conjugative transposon ATPase [Pedobacter antarcticus]SDM83438.1 Bacteroides conjugation system ATPase, TraG family [Pedobacter antarcticus]
MAQKRKTEFNLPYFGIDEDGKYSTIYNLKGDYGVVIQINNPVLQYSADPGAYDSSHQLYVNITKILGEGYVIQKQDVLTKKIYNKSDSTEYLQQKYDEHFNGREYTDLTTYLVVTRKAKRGSFYSYNKKNYIDFEQNIGKLEDLLKRNNLSPKILTRNEIDLYVKRILSMNFSANNVSLNNMRATDVEIQMGDKAVRSIPLVNIDTIDLPEKVSTHIERNDKDTLKGFPIDTMGFLYNVPLYQTIIYNQIIDIPAQNMTQRKLELKRKRHSGIPDPANLMCVEDIDNLLVDVARENQMLVYCHFNILVCAPLEAIQQTCNYIESSLFQQSIIPNKNAYNQMELFRTALPCNTVELADYDLFLTTADAALCFFFKEALSKDEVSGFQIRFTDRQGIPVAIDPADLPMQTNRINNRNKFVLGPSGSGKSFFMNALIEQYCMYNKSEKPKWLMDVVIVDTGHSYSGLCSYYGGKYITYSEEKPITMNPFAISEGEYNIEKKDFLKTLISLLWKGADGTVNQVESDVISQAISSYYSNFFDKPFFVDITDEEENEILKEAEAEAADFDYTVRAKEILDENDIKNQAQELANDLAGTPDEKLSHYEQEYERIYNLALQATIESLREDDADDIFSRKLYEARVAKKEEFKRKNVVELNFNSFYEFALYKIPEIKEQERIPFDIDEFRFVLKKFYKGGEFQAILNEEADNSMFTESFVVFEIDSIKEHKTLFPIVTLIIMDVFIQKMRFRTEQRKALIIEEAWKAIASPLMAGYILYLYKTVRKFWGEAIVVTQELGDIIGNAVVKDSIINNSDTTMLLDQSKFKDNFDEIAKLLAINAHERKKILTINQLDNHENRGRFKEVYIRRGATGEVYGVEVALEQYLIYTTEKPEKTAVEYYSNFYGSYRAGIDNFVKDLKLSGLKLPQFFNKVNSMRRPIYEEGKAEILQLVS